MLRKISLLLFIAIFLQFSLPHPTIAQDEELKTAPILQPEKNSDEPDYVEGEVIVKYKSEKKRTAALKKITSLSEENDVAVKDTIDDSNIAVLKSEKKSTTELMDEMGKDTSVDFVEPNYRRELAYLPNDTFFSSQWSHKNTGQSIDGTSGTSDADISTAEMWDIESNSAASTTIAVIDGGIYYNNSELLSNMWDGSSDCKSDTGAAISCPNHGWDFFDNDNDPLPNLSETNIDPDHGTFVASVAAAMTNNNQGIAGMSRYNHNKIMALRFGLSVATEIKAIHFAKNNGAKIINASFVGSTFSQLEKDAIDSFPGIFAAAAGNAGKDVGTTPQYPCAYSSSNIICVGASDQNDALASFSNYSATGVDVVAPGENLVGLYGNSYVIGGGTSFAAPQVAGLAGVLWSQNSSASIATAKDTILKSSDHKSNLSGQIACGRRLNADAALANMQSSTVPNEYCPNPIYRFWSNTYNHHFYTISAEERNDVIANFSDNWTYEGVGFYGHTKQQTNAYPVYRFWSDKYNGHFYTISENEKNDVTNRFSDTWSYEGIAYYAYKTQQAKSTPLYRFWSNKYNSHFYTISAEEKDSVIANLSDTWTYEGIGYYIPTF